MLLCCLMDYYSKTLIFVNTFFRINLSLTINFRIKEAQLLRYFDASVEQKNFMTTSEVDNIISLTRQNISNLKSQKDFLRRKLTGEVAIGESFRRNPMPIDPKVLEKRRDLFDRNNIKNKVFFIIVVITNTYYIAKLSKK